MSTENATKTTAEPVLYWCPEAREIETQPGGGFDTCCHAPELHEPVLPVVYAAIRQQVEREVTLDALRLIADTRQQVAQEIAAALDAIPGTAYPEDVFPPDGTSTDCQSARVMRSAYPAAARIAREIGGVE